MRYEEYEKRIMKIAKVKHTVVRHRAPILSMISIIIVLIIAYLLSAGSFTQEVLCLDTELVYGEKLTCSANALFSNVYYSSDSRKLSSSSYIFN